MSINSTLNVISSSRKRQLLFLIFAFLSIAIMIVIFCFSAQDAAKSVEVGLSVNNVINKGVDKLSDSIPKESIEQIKNAIANYLRKSAHVFLYTALGFSLFGCLYSSERPKRIPYKMGIALATGIVYSITDEVHQIFVKGRSCEFFDIALDTAGVVLGILTMLALFGIYKLFDRKKPKSA